MKHVNIFLINLINFGNPSQWVKHDEAQAAFDNGILTLTIPKVEKVKPKQIKVKAKGVIEGKK